MTTSLSPVDLLAIGPHPDDIEIGIGGIVAKHVALGHRVGLCDLTAGEMGSNGTVDERLAEAEAARARARRGVAHEPAPCQTARLGARRISMRAVAGLVRSAQPRVVAVPYWSDRHPDHVAASQLLTEGDVQCRVFGDTMRMARRGSPSRSATTSSTIPLRRRSSWT